MEFERIACKKFKNFSSFYDYCYIFDISGQILTKSGFYEWRMCDRILYSFPKGMRFSMNKTKLDKTSIIMTVIFSVIVLLAVVGLIFAATNKKTENEENAPVIDVSDVEGAGEGLLTAEDIMKIVPNAEPGSTYSYYDDDGNLRSVTIPEQASETSQALDFSDKYKFTEFTDLSDKFLEVCRAGDVEELYKLYYPGFLEKGRLIMDPVLSVEEFNAGLRNNMLSVTGFDEYEYGCMELPPTQSPGAYAAQIYYNMYGEAIPLSASDVENCVNLVVYINNMYETNHFMVLVDGYWYFIV